MAQRCPLSIALILSGAVLAGLPACEKHDDSGADAKTTEPAPAFKTVQDGEELPECCQPDSAVIDRTAGKSKLDMGAPASRPDGGMDRAVLEAQALRTDESVAAQVGSIQTSVDPKINGTIIGRKVDFDLNFVNQDGRPINLARDYAGRTIVLSTIFTSCPTPEACPRITDDFAHLATKIPDQLADKIQLVLVSFDPRNDTPEVLHLWGRTHGIDFSRVDLLTGDIETVKRLMERELEIPIVIDEVTGAFSNHALMVHVINADGYVVVERAATSSAVFSTLLDEAIRSATMEFVAPKSSG